MKTLISIAIAAMIITAGTGLKAQDYHQEYLGLPGDNLNLYAVMRLFEESRTLGTFERELNARGNRINNLDLNGDNLVDYITVSDILNDNIHYVVMRVPVNRYESQDVGVFTIIRYSNKRIYVQLTGDEALYGKDYIIEPAERVTLGNWSVLRNLFRPDYIAWHSEWYWDYYPSYWNPWRPYYWDAYYEYHYDYFDDYYICYHRGYSHYDPHWNDHYYTSARKWSPVVTRNIDNGHYRDTYSRPERSGNNRENENSSYRGQGRRVAYPSSTGSNTVRNNNPAGTVNRPVVTETNRRNSEITNGGTDRSSGTIQIESTGRRQGGSPVTNSGRINNQASGNPFPEQRPQNNDNRVRTTNNDETRRASVNSGAVQVSEPDRRPSTTISSRPEVRTETRSEVKTETRPEVRNEARTEIRTERSQNTTPARSNTESSTTTRRTEESKVKSETTVSTGSTRRR